jgi:hypothetical protein
LHSTGQGVLHFLQPFSPGVGFRTSQPREGWLRTLAHALRHLSVRGVRWRHVQ